MSNASSTAIKYGAKLKTFKSYITGFILSIILTLAAFACVGKHWLSGEALYITITALALMQLLVQVICFLRMNTTSEGRWNTLPFIFTIVIVGVLVGGSLWIMYNLNINMM